MFFFCMLRSAMRRYAYHPYRERHVQHYQDCGGTEGICFKMQRSAYCVCSLTFHARCWPGDVLSRAPLWCQDRRSLHRRSNNSCSKTQQVSLGIYFHKSGINFNFDFFSIFSIFKEILKLICVLFFFFNVHETRSKTKQTLDTRRVVCSSSLFYYCLLLSLDTSNSLRNLFRNLFQILTICAIASSPFLATSS